MATYSDFITKVRADVGDFGMRRYETADGDAATTLFNLKHPKMLESSTVIRISSVVQAAAAYTLYPDTAQVIFSSAPASGSDNVSFEYQSVNLLDADWIDVINQVLSHWRRKIWKEITDETTLDTVADQYDYATSSVAADIIRVLNLEYRVSSTDAWRDVRGVTNAMFYKDLQKIHLRPAFSTSGYDIRVRALRAYVQGTTTGATFEPQERYWPAIRRMAAAIYYERRAAAMMKETGAVTREKSFEDTATMFKLARQAKEDAEKMMAQVRPSKPSIAIPNAIAGINL
jgi:hypothetical protein